MTYKKLFESVSVLAHQISALHQQIAKQCEPTVRMLIRTNSQDVRLIEQTLDQLLDVACHEDGLRLFRRLCRYYWHINPQTTADYIYGYREMLDEQYEPADVDASTTDSIDNE